MKNVKTSAGFCKTNLTIQSLFEAKITDERIYSDLHFVLYLNNIFFLAVDFLNSNEMDSLRYSQMIRNKL